MLHWHLRGERVANGSRFSLVTRWSPFHSSLTRLTSAMSHQRAGEPLSIISWVEDAVKEPDGCCQN